MDNFSDELIQHKEAFDWLEDAAAKNIDAEYILGFIEGLEARFKELEDFMIIYEDMYRSADKAKARLS